MKSTGAKTYLVQYRNTEGRTRRLALGPHGVLTPDQARAEARQKLASASRGEDPSEERHRLRHGKTVGEMCDWYLEHAKSGRILGRRRRPIKPSTLAMDESRIETHIRPLLGSRSIKGLTIWDIEGMQAAIVAGKTAKSAPGGAGSPPAGPGVAARAVGTLRSILGHATRVGMIERNPAAGVRLVASTQRSRRLSLAELRLLGAALSAGGSRGRASHRPGGETLKRRLRTGTIVTTDDRNWELRYTSSALQFNQSRAVGIDMESATIAAQGYRFRVPTAPCSASLTSRCMARSSYRARPTSSMNGPSRNT